MVAVEISPILDNLYNFRDRSLLAPFLLAGGGLTPHRSALERVSLTDVLLIFEQDDFRVEKMARETRNILRIFPKIVISLI